MTNLSQTVLDVLHDHRDSIDRLDAILIYTLGERFRHTQAIGKLKAVNNLPPLTLTAKGIKFQGLRIFLMKPV